MGLEWFEYYDVKGDIRSLRQQVEAIKKELADLKKEIETERQKAK